MNVFHAKILERNFQKCDVAIHSHSQAVEALNFHVIESKLTQECWSKTNDTGKKNKVSLFWVPDFSGSDYLMDG